MDRPAPANSGIPLLIILISCALISGAGCAKIAEPRPPQVRIPKPAADLAVRQVADYVVLSVSMPETNTNGSTPVILKSMEVYRLTESLSGETTGLSDQQFLKQAKRILSIPSSKLKEFLNDRLLVCLDRFEDDKIGMYAHPYRYAVLFVNNKNQSAGLSNQAVITAVPLPPSPTGITANGTQNFIRLKWTAPSVNTDGSSPARTAGFNIYRTQDPKKFPSTPINATPVTLTEYEDANFQFETTYYYAITTVGILRQPYPESLPSQSVSITTKDIFPPAPPLDFNALVQETSITLLWEPSPSSDVVGYRLYRVDKGKGDRKLVQPELIRGVSFRDIAVEPGKSYEYEIQSVDAYGNASTAVKADSEQQ